MKLLLDTHALPWWPYDDPKLGSHAKDLIADPANHVLVSVVSLWEILVKMRAGKLVAGVEDILDEMKVQGFGLLEINPAHLLALATLPMHHKDSFDHLLIAQAITEGATFLSEDSYPPGIQCSMWPARTRCPSCRNLELHSRSEAQLLSLCVAVRISA